MRRTGGRARRWFPGTLGLAVAVLLAFTGCGSSSPDGTASTTSSDGTDRTEAPSPSDPTTTETKQSVPIEKRVTLAATIAPADTAIAFTATFRPTLAGSYGFRSDADDPVVVEVVAPPRLALDEVAKVSGTVHATGPGTGAARLTATITTDGSAGSPGGAGGAGGSTEETTITLFVASSDGWTTVGTSSTSATQRALLDALRSRHVIDDAEYQRRLDRLTGGT